MTNLEYLEKVKYENVDYKIFKEVGEHEIEYRKMKALEIIAEEKIKTNDILSTISVILEDIITVLRQR